MNRIAISLILLSGFVLYFFGCGTSRGEGYQLAKTHCQGCHLWPDPALLDKKTWANHVLPKMGSLLGFGSFGNSAYYERGSGEAMPLTDWNKLTAYYVKNAPDSLIQEEEIAIGATLAGFSVRPVMGAKEPMITYTGFEKNRRQIFFGDAGANRLFRATGAGTVVDSLATETGVVQVRTTDQELWALSMGVLYPSNERKGRLLRYHGAQQALTVLDSLQRPVYAEYADLNNDNLEDIIICEFGYTEGRLSWFRNNGNQTYTQQVLRPLPGAIRSQVVDLDKDGKPDIVALMAQGDEGFFAYYNKGGGRFEEKRLVRLPPSYGSNYFELADFNGDGAPDLLATNGDNGDYPPVLKPYHGVRIYLNDGKNQFREEVFLPMNGAGKAMAADFDKDGDLDIAAISYFPDYQQHPEESFLYWQNTGGLQYRASAPKEAASGRWLTMDAGDVDADGDLDILLGNATFTVGAIPAWIKEKWARMSPSVLIVENRHTP